MLCILQEGLARRVIEQGMFVKHYKVEVYLMDLRLCTNSDVDTTTTLQFSRQDSIGILLMLYLISRRKA